MRPRYRPSDRMLREEKRGGEDGGVSILFVCVCVCVLYLTVSHGLICGQPTRRVAWKDFVK